MRPLFLREIIQQLPHVGVFRSARGLLIEPARFYFDRASLLPHDIQSQRTYEPDRATLHEPLYVLPPNERNVFAEFLAIQFDEPSPMTGFLALHRIK